MENKVEKCLLYDVYDENGALLVPKGTVITENLERMLKRRSIVYEIAEKIMETAAAEDERKYFLEDIYDRNGRLLVPKGTEITENIENLLRIRHIHFKAGPKSQLEARPLKPDCQKKAPCYANDRVAKILKPAVAVNRRNIADIRTNISNVAIRMPQIDYLSLMGASETVMGILDEGKNEMWGLHINSLANCVDWIYSHSINVSIISTMLAQKLNFPSKMVYYTGVAAILHDIGMVMVPDEVLNCPGKLADEDEKLIHSHPLLGYRMLLNTKLPEEVPLAVLQHHEKVNGRGYPSSLPEKEICGIAKVIRVVDTFDSMTSDRPHRKARPLQETLAEMKLGEGEEFDNVILKHFLRLFHMGD